MIETFLVRRDTLPDHQRSKTASALAARVRTRLDIAADVPVADETLLEDIAAEYRGR